LAGPEVGGGSVGLIGESTGGTGVRGGGACLSGRQAEAGNGDNGWRRDGGAGITKSRIACTISAKRMGVGKRGVI